jgi:hypothetical protein
LAGVLGSRARAVRLAAAAERGRDPATPEVAAPGELFVQLRSLPLQVGG